MEEQKYTVYGIIHKESEELIYVGMTHMTLEKRWFYHTWIDDTKFIKSIPVKKYMINNGGFSEYMIKEISSCESLQELIEWETQLIQELDPICNVMGRLK